MSPKEIVFQPRTYAEDTKGRIIAIGFLDVDAALAWASRRALGYFSVYVAVVITKKVTDLSFPFTTAEASAAELLDRINIFTFFVGTRSFLSGKVGCFVAGEAIDPRQVEN